MTTGYGVQATGDRIARAFLPFLFFVLVAVVYFFPVIQHFTTSVAGVGGDPYQSLWRIVKLGDAVKHGSLVVAEESNFPNLSPLPWLPIYYLFGEITAYNTAWFFSAILAGLLCYKLARLWGATFWPALVAGLLTELAPYRVAQSLGHFGAMQFWVIFAVLIFLTLWHREKKFIWFLLGLVFTVWTAWTDHQLFVVLLLTLAVFGIAYWREIVIRVNFFNGLTLIKYVLIFVALFIAIAPSLGTLKNISKVDNHLTANATQRELFSASWRSILLPAPFALIASGKFDAEIASDGVQTLGIILPLTVAVLFIARKKQKREVVVLLLALLGILLSLGTVLHLRGYAIPLPTKLFYALPILSSIRTVGRFIVLPVMFLPVLLAVQWGKINRKFFFWAPVLALIEILPVFGFPVLAINHHEAKIVADNLNAGAVLALPAYTNYRYGSEQLYYSLDYKRPVVGNSALGRIVDPKTQEIFLATPVIRDLVLLRLGDFSLPTIFGQQNQAIASLAFEAQGIGSVILETNPEGGVISYEGNKQRPLTPEQVGSVRNYLRDTLGFAEEQVTASTFVYKVPAVSGTSAQYFIMEGNGWQIQKKTLDRAIIQLEKNSEFYVYSKIPATMELVATVINPPANFNAIVASENGEETVKIGANNQLKIRLSVPPNTYVKYRMTLDGSEILLENPRIQSYTPGQ